MHSLSSPLSAALGAPVQQPAVLVEVAFSTVRRWSSFAELTWGGQTWQRAAMSIDDLSVAALSVSGTLVMDNRDGAIGALVLSEGVADRAIRIWGYDAAATGAGDVVLICEAVGAGVTFGLQTVSIGLRAASEFLLAPRTFVGASAGFGYLVPAGTVLRINGQDYRMERR